MAKSEWTTLSLLKNAEHKEQFIADLKDKSSEYLKSLMQWSEEESSRLKDNNIIEYSQAYALQATLLAKILKERKIEENNDEIIEQTPNKKTRRI